MKELEMEKRTKNMNLCARMAEFNRSGGLRKEKEPVFCCERLVSIPRVSGCVSIHLTDGYGQQFRRVLTLVTFQFVVSIGLHWISSLK